MYALGVGRMVCDGRRMTATVVLQLAMAAAAAARRPEHAYLGPEGLRCGHFGDAQQWRKAGDFKKQMRLPARALRARDV